MAMVRSVTFPVQVMINLPCDISDITSLNALKLNYIYNFACLLKCHLLFFFECQMIGVKEILLTSVYVKPNEFSELRQLLKRREEPLEFGKIAATAEIRFKIPRSAEN